MLAGDIGRCGSCHLEPCTHPKVRQKTPEKGCLDWHTNTPLPQTVFQPTPEEIALGANPYTP